MPSQQLLVLVAFLLSCSDIVSGAPTPSKYHQHTKQHVRPGFFDSLIRRDGKYKGSGRLASHHSKSTKFRKLRTRDATSDLIATGLPGYINIQSSEFNSTSTVTIGNLVLSAGNDSSTDNSTSPNFALDASATRSTQVWMTPYDMAPDSTDPVSNNVTYSGLEFTPHIFEDQTLLPVTLRLPVYQASTATSEPYCASFPAYAETKSSLTLRACQGATDGGVDDQGYSQMFWFDPSTGAIRPNWNSTAPTGQGIMGADQSSQSTSIMSNIVTSAYTTATAITAQQVPGMSASVSANPTAAYTITSAISAEQVAQISSFASANPTSANAITSGMSSEPMPTQSSSSTTSFISAVPIKAAFEAGVFDESSSATVNPHAQVTEVHTMTLVNLDVTTAIKSTATVTLVPTQTTTVVQAVTVPLEAMEVTTVTAWLTAYPTAFSGTAGLDSTLTGFWPETAITAMQAVPTALTAAAEALPSGSMSTLDVPSMVSAASAPTQSISPTPQNLTMIFTPSSDAAKASLANGQYSLNATMLADSQDEIASDFTSGMATPTAAVELPSLTAGVSTAVASSTDPMERRGIAVAVLQNMGPGPSVVDPYELVFKRA